jgi:adenylate cyclase
MFTDFVGFTTAAEKLAAEDLVALLHEYFTAFDEITKRHGLEKMKTVGDSYMCIGGLPVRNPSHPVDTVRAALEMVQYVVERPRGEVPVEWAMRVGIHTGPVVAGVVGTLKFAFDIWGDTVNFSSRMESSGVPNRVNISERTYARVKDFFECEHRGKILTKDKREVDMYLVQGVSPRLAAPEEFARRYNVYFQKSPPESRMIAARQA